MEAGWSGCKWSEKTHFACKIKITKVTFFGFVQIHCKRFGNLPGFVAYYKNRLENHGKVNIVKYHDLWYSYSEKYHVLWCICI